MPVYVLYENQRMTVPFQGDTAFGSGDESPRMSLVSLERNLRKRFPLVGLYDTFIFSITGGNQDRREDLSVADETILVLSIGEGRDDHHECQLFQKLQKIPASDCPPAVLALKDSYKRRIDKSKPDGFCYYCE